MDLSALLPWNWFRRPGPAPEDKGLKVVRVPENSAQDDTCWPDPDSPDCIGYELDRLFDHAFDGFGFSVPHLQAAMQEQRPCAPPTRSCATQDAHTFQDVTLTIRLPRLHHGQPKLHAQND